MEVGDKEQGHGAGGIEEEQVAGRQVQQEPSPVHHQQVGHLLGQHQPARMKQRG